MTFTPANSAGMAAAAAQARNGEAETHRLAANRALLDGATAPAVAAFAASAEAMDSVAASWDEAADAYRRAADEADRAAVQARSAARSDRSEIERAKAMA